MHCLHLFRLALLASLLPATVPAGEVLLVSDHNYDPSHTSAIVAIDETTGYQTQLTQPAAFVASDLFGLTYESPTSVLALSANYGNGVLYRVNTGTGSVQQIASGLGEAIYPVVGPSDTIYVADSGWLGAPGGIWRINSDATTDEIIFGGRPTGMVYDSLSGLVYVTGQTVNNGAPGVAVLNLGSNSWRRLDTGNATFMTPMQIAINPVTKNLLVADGGAEQQYGASAIWSIDPLHPELAAKLYSGPATVSDGAGNQFNLNLRAVWVNPSGTIFVGGYNLSVGDGASAVFTLDPTNAQLTLVSGPPQLGDGLRNLVGLTGGDFELSPTHKVPDTTSTLLLAVVSAVALAAMGQIIPGHKPVRS